jgi:hypothetical protein
MDTRSSELQFSQGLVVKPIKLKNIMTIFTCMTVQQKDILGVDKKLIKASRLRTPLVVVTCGAGILVAMTIAAMKGGTSSFSISGFLNYNFYIYAAFSIAFALI